jgi:N utilization substance protein A
VRQTINQRIRQFEKERIFDDYKDQMGDIVTGIVRRWDRGDLVIDLGKAEAIMPVKERITSEDYAPGDRIRALLLTIESTSRGPEIILSRASAQFVRRLFELEVAELVDGAVTIKAFVREPGYRTKIAVDATDPKVDPVGACVGSRGARVKGIVRELGGEKVDVIHYYEDPRRMLEEAIKPAAVKNLRVNEAERRLYFEVAEADISLVLGSRGRNAKLISKLMGWRLDITKEVAGATGFDVRLQKAVAGIRHLPGMTDALAERLVAIGITGVDAFEGVTAADLEEAGFSSSEVDTILSAVRSKHKS